MALNIYKKPPDDVFCPLMNSVLSASMGERKPMSETCPSCAMWTGVTGQPSSKQADISGEIGLGFVCAMQAQFQGQIEIAAQLRSLGAATESMRNEIVQRMDEHVTLSPPATVRLLEARK